MKTRVQAYSMLYKLIRIFWMEYGRPPLEGHDVLKELRMMMEIERILKRLR